MAKNSKKIVPVNSMAVAIHVECPMQAQRCRAGYVFKQGETKRIELSELTSEQLDLLNDDPYLKVAFEADETLEDISEARILELDAKLAEKDTELATANERIVNLEMAVEAKQTGIDELKTQLEAKDTEIAELKAATAPKAKK